MLAIACAWAGVYLSSVRGVAHRLVSFGGGALVGVTLFWVWPELAKTLGLATATLGLCGGGLVLALIDRYVYPVCPACAPSHDHDHCATTLHGFALPLLIASAVHGALDGWNLAAAQQEVELTVAFAGGVLAHKIPEGLALGVIARASFASRNTALVWCALAEGATLVGAMLEQTLAPHLSLPALDGLLALAGGSFLYLGWHAIDGEYRHRGWRAWMPAALGMAVAAATRLVLG
jgi:zinc transporter ZupT